MATEDVKQHATGKWISILNLLLGVWLILAPWVLGYWSIGVADWNQRVIGSIIIGTALVRLAVPDRYHGLSWVNFVMGAWLIVAPFVLVSSAGSTVRPQGMYGTGGSSLVFANDIVIGILVLAVASWSTLASRPRI